MKNNSFTGLFIIVLLWFFILPNGIKDKPNNNTYTKDCSFSESGNNNSEELNYSKDIFSSIYVGTINGSQSKTAKPNERTIHFHNTFLKENSPTTQSINDYLFFSGSFYFVNHIKLRRLNI